jgi:hypothetical protein
VRAFGRVGVVGREVGDRALGKRLADRFHDRAGALAGLVVVHLLDDTSGYCPARLGASEPLSPCAPWHIVQLSASVAPRPTASLPLARAIERSRTTSVDTGGAVRAASVAAAPARGSAGGAADARPEPLRAEVGLRRRQPEEADEHRDDGERDEDADARPHPRVAPRHRCGLGHHRLPIGTIGTDASFRSASWTIG